MTSLRRGGYTRTRWASTIRRGARRASKRVGLRRGRCSTMSRSRHGCRVAMVLQLVSRNLRGMIHRCHRLRRLYPGCLFGQGQDERRCVKNKMITCIVPSRVVVGNTFFVLHSRIDGTAWYQRGIIIHVEKLLFSQLGRIQSTDTLPPPPRVSCLLAH